MLASSVGEFDAAKSYLGTLEQEKKITPFGLHVLARVALCQDRVDNHALEAATDYVKKGGSESESDSFDTLAAIQAELGKPVEALQNLHRAVESHNGWLESPDWYVLGRIAEEYGLGDAAVANYRKITPAKPASADSCFALGQRRMKRLGQ
jgi:hypothetical protein